MCTTATTAVSAWGLTAEVALVEGTEQPQLLRRQEGGSAGEMPLPTPGSLITVCTRSGGTYGFSRAATCI